MAGARRGVLNLPGVREDVGLIGIHHQGLFIELVPWNGSIQWDIAPWGRCAPPLPQHGTIQGRAFFGDQTRNEASLCSIAKTLVGFCWWICARFGTF